MVTLLLELNFYKGTQGRNVSTEKTEKKKKKNTFSDTGEKSYVENEVMEDRVGGLGPHGMGTPGKGRHC